MKKILAIAVMGLMFTACSNAKKEEAIRVAAVKAVKDSIRLDSFKRADAEQKLQAAKLQEEKRILMLAEEKAAENAPAATMAAPRVAGSSSQASVTETNSKKKGWSSAALGTVIGAGAGGLGGALIDKKKGRGAVIGGVAGAGAGYLIGRGQDKKSGRAN